MPQTMELLAKALAKQRAAQWCKAFGIDASVITQARKRGNLSPALAGNFAMELGESPEHWMAIAAMEAERDSPLLQRLKQRQEIWRKL